MLDKLLINADNGPESSGQRTQWLKRMMEFSDANNIEIELSDYLPYYSKYNPVEMLWGVLENHWRGELLTSTDKALGLARNMTYYGITPSSVRLIKQIYLKGVRPKKKQMAVVEKRLQRLPGFEKWFVTICPMANS